MDENIASQFMRQTYHENLPPSAQKQGVPMPPFELPYDENVQLIPLPDPHQWQPQPLDITRAIEQRRSIRRYAPTPLDLTELGYLLWCTQGIQKITPAQTTLRTVPSAGARHALETYLMIQHVHGLQPGLMRYIASRHALLPLRSQNGMLDELTDLCHHQEMVRQSAVTFLWVGVAERITWRSGARGYRYLHLDVGHVCQNLYLAAEALHCGTCAIMSFDDAGLNSWLGLDGETCFILYASSLGKKEG